MNLSDYGRSVIRTVVPLLVGTLVGWLATKGVKVDQTAATALADTTIAGAYYAVVRWAEHKWPQAGWLLGAPGAPSYSSGSTTGSATPATVPGGTVPDWMTGDTPTQ